MAVRIASGMLACALALGLGGVARGQSTGDVVRIETASGVVEGTLVDRLPQGYLVNKGKASEVVPYAKVKSIARVAPAPLAMPPPPVAPVPPPPAAHVPAAQLTDEAVAPGLASDPLPPPETAPAGSEPPPPPAAPPMLAPPALPPPSFLPPPPSSPMPEVRYERRSTWVMASGIALFGAGVITATVGALVFINAEGTSSTVYDGYNYGDNSSRTTQMNNAMIATGVGVAAVAVGVTLWSIGGSKVRVHDQPVTFAVGPGSAQMSMKF